MRLRLTSLLPWPVERVVAELAYTERLNQLDAPVLAFEPLDPPAFPERWRTGRYRVRLRVAGGLPIGEHTLDVRRLVGPGDPLPEGPVEVWRDAGFSDLIERWDHRIVLEPFHGMTRYSDVAEIEAGPLTVPAWLFAHLLYRARQRSLRALVRRTPA